MFKEKRYFFMGYLIKGRFLKYSVWRPGSKYDGPESFRTRTVAGAVLKIEDDYREMVLEQLQKGGMTIIPKGEDKYKAE